MTVGELLRRINARELAEWQIFYGLEPFGVERADLQHGMVAATIANYHRGKGTQPFAPGDFVLSFEQPQKQTPQDHADYFKRLTQSMGGTVIGG